MIIRSKIKKLKKIQNPNHSRRLSPSLHRTQGSGRPKTKAHLPRLQRSASNKDVSNSVISKNREHISYRNSPATTEPQIPSGQEARVSKNTEFIPFNGLPITGPQITSNVIKCKFYEAGRCIFGSRCKFSHTFKDAFQIEQLSHNSAEALTFSSNNLKHNLRNISFPHESISKAILCEYGQQSLLFLASNKCRLFIYNAHNFQLTSSLKLSPHGDFTPVILESKRSAEAIEDGSINILILDYAAGDLWIVDVLSKRTIRRFHVDRDIYSMKLMSINYVTYPERNLSSPSMVYFKRTEKQQSFVVLYRNNGSFKFINLFQGKVVKSFITGTSFMDFIISQTQSQSNFKVPLRQGLNTLYLAGKGIHVWDLQGGKAVRTMTYNQYSWYLKVVEFSEMRDSNNRQKKLLISIGHLCDPIIRFLYDIFIEIWNPETGGCVKRFTNTAIELDPLWIAQVNLLLLKNRPGTCVEVERKVREGDGMVFIVSVPVNIQAWDVQDSEKPLWEIKGDYDPETLHLMQNEKELEIRVMGLEQPKEVSVWKMDKRDRILQE